MGTIRASCPDCGDVELTTADMVVRVCSDDNKGAYSFRCPDCTMTVLKDAEQRIVDLLVSSGVRLTVWRLPAEIEEIQRKQGPKLDHNDLLALHELLETDDWFTRLSAMVVE